MAKGGIPTAQQEHPSRAAGWRYTRHGLARLHRPAHPLLGAAIGAGLVVYAWVDGSAAPFSRGAFVGVLIPGAVLAAIACGRPPERIAAPRELDAAGMSYWVITLAAFFEWEASAYKDNSWPWHPSFTDLVNPLLGPHLVKSAAIVVWLLAGWALVRR
jgi:hypothetical protein